MSKRFYTIDDLYKFCKTNQYSNFSSVDSGKPLIVQSFGSFEAEEEYNDILPVKLKSCHVGKNANKSGITVEAMNKYKDTFKGKPILGAIHKTDTGEYEFHSHDMEIVENEDGEKEVQYVEQIVGSISEIDEPYLEYDENEEKDYLMVNGRIFSNYSKASEILQRHKTCKCSVEIAVDEMSYNCEEDYLSIDAFQFLGVTILGYEQDGVTEIQEGMKGSKITIDDFSSSTNSMNYQFYNDKLIKTLDELNLTLKDFNKHNDKKGGDNMDKLNELLTKYNKTLEDLTFDYEGLSDEELEAKFVELFEEKDNSVIENFVKEFKIEISHEDIRYALYNLIAPYEEQDNDYYYIREVFDDYFIMQGYCQNRLFKMGYSVEDSEVSLVGDRQEVYEIIVTESEKLEIEEMRANYAGIVAERDSLAQFKSDTEKAELKSKKDSIFNNDKYVNVKNTKAFNNLMENCDQYSIEECENMADNIYDDFTNYVANFSQINQESEQGVLVFDSNVPNHEEKNDPYAGLFD